MEQVSLVISKDAFSFLLDNDLLGEHTVKEVIIKDDLFKDDAEHKALLKAYLKARENLREYEFKKRNP